MTFVVPIIIIVAAIALSLLVGQQNPVYVYSDGIFIKGIYGRRIPISSIRSIRLVEQMPRIYMRSGFSGFHRLKGYCRLSTGRSGMFGEKALVHRMKRSGSFIEIDTDRGLIYLNRKNEEQTVALFHEMEPLQKGDLLP